MKKSVAQEQEEKKDKDKTGLLWCAGYLIRIVFYLLIIPAVIVLSLLIGGGLPQL